MRTYNDIIRDHPKALISRDVFASYYSDGADEEWVYFKLLPWNTVRFLVKGMQQMRLFRHYRLERDEEEYRNGYVNEKACLRMIERDEAFLQLDEFKRIASELVEAMGYHLHWIPVTRILNMNYN